ncbi:MAG: hypothetical protein M3Y73_14450 [Actinomycetota bacterium]|nr:hypothetical protein [Actinomycetota bacterium]
MAALGALGALMLRSGPAPAAPTGSTPVPQATPSALPANGQVQDSATTIDPARGTNGLVGVRGRRSG